MLVYQRVSRMTDIYCWNTASYFISQRIGSWENMGNQRETIYDRFFSINPAIHFLKICRPYRETTSFWVELGWFWCASTPFFYGYITTFNWNCTPKCIKQVYQTMLSTSTSFLRIPSLCGKHTLPRQQGNKWIAKGPETISMLTLKPGSNGSTVDTYIYIYIYINN